MIDVLGTDLFGNPIVQRPDSPLFRKFTWAPFTVLDAKSGDWQARKRAWLSLGIQSEVGRGQYLMDDSKSSVYNGRSEWSGVRGAKLPGEIKGTGDFVGTHDKSTTASIRLSYGETGTVLGAGTSIFDPVVCELCYRWFAPAGGAILDPFAGGSVRGVVASMLGFSYVGFDLSERQVAANREQAEVICKDHPKPLWVVGDSTTEDFGGPYDFVFSCPPYGDLEVYSEDPRDLSNVSHERFLEGMGAVLKRAAAVLAPDRFAAFVVGDFRGEDGIYRAFPSSMIRLAAEAGLRYYNEAILLTSIGSLPIRVSFAWDRGRKLGRTHQNILVFAKGDPVAAARVVVASWKQEEEADEVVAEALAEAPAAEPEIAPRVVEVAPAPVLEHQPLRLPGETPKPTGAVQESLF